MFNMEIKMTEEKRLKYKTITREEVRTWCGDSKLAVPDAVFESFTFLHEILTGEIDLTAARIKVLSLKKEGAIRDAKREYDEAVERVDEAVEELDVAQCHAGITDKEYNRLLKIKEAEND